MATDALSIRGKNELLFAEFARMISSQDCRRLANRMAKPKGWCTDHDLENQTHPWDIDSSSHALTDVCDSARRGATRRAIGAVPGDCWGVGNLRSAFREIKVKSSVSHYRESVASNPSAPEPRRVYPSTPRIHQRPIPFSRTGFATYGRRAELLQRKIRRP